MANILLIDDEQVLLGLISHTLRLDGHDVHALCDPLAAIAYCAEGRAFDLLLTDIDMKPISGFELVKRLGFTGPVLFMSGYPALAGAVAERLGAHAIVEKPFTAVQLLSAVGKALGRGEAQSPLAA